MSSIRNAKQRKESIRIIKALGGDLDARAIWARMPIEGLFSRWKRMLGETLRSKLEATAAIEIYGKSLIMNKVIKIT